MLFFTPESIAFEDTKHLLMRHLDPLDWEHQDLGSCYYTDLVNQRHQYAISFTSKLSIIQKLEIQTVDVDTIYTHTFTSAIVKPDNPTITPKPVGNFLEKWAKEETIKYPKGTCPKNGKAIACFAHAFKKGTSFFGKP